MLTVALILVLAGGLVPLIQRDLRIARVRIQERRRREHMLRLVAEAQAIRAAMTPIERALDDFARAARSFGVAVSEAVAGVARFQQWLRSVGERIEGPR